MTANILPRWLALIGTVLALALMPAGAVQAKKKAAAPPPEISAFELEPVNQVAPGTELFFRLQGTPNGRATVRIGGVGRTLVLQEVDDGVYEGGYTLRPNDRTSAASNAIATLRRNGRSSTVTIGRLAAAAPPAPPQAQQQPKAPAVLAIQRFSATPVERFEPGAELKFQLSGTPGAHATFNIENVIANVPMRETSPGRYEGAYTIRRLDRIPSGVQVVAALESGGQTVRTSLDRASVLSDTKPPTVRNVYPREGETIPAGMVPVSGTFDDSGGVGVDPKSVKVVVDGRDDTASSTITRDYFTYRTDLGPGNHSAEVTAKDQAGNAVRQAWSWVVQAQPAPLTLEVTSPHQNAVVPRGRLEIRGKTAPGASVSMDAQGYASLAGMVGVSQPLFKDKTVADPDGNFSFTFVSPFNAPGLRYEIDLKAEQGGHTREQKLVLFQPK
jgi:hypothetical protein